MTTAAGFPPKVEEVNASTMKKDVEPIEKLAKVVEGFY